MKNKILESVAEELIYNVAGRALITKHYASTQEKYCIVHEPMRDTSYYLW